MQADLPDRQFPSETDPRGTPEAARAEGAGVATRWPAAWRVAIAGLVFAVVATAAVAAPDPPASSRASSRLDLDARLARVRELDDQGSFARAESLGRVALQDAERAFGPDSKQALKALDTYVRAATKIAPRQLLVTRALIERSLALHVRRQGRRNDDVAETLSLLARMLVWQRKFDSAQVVLDEVVAIRRARHGPDHPTVARAHLELTVLDFHRKNPKGEIDHARQAMEIVGRSATPDSFLLGRAYGARGRGHLALKEYDEAERWLTASRDVLARHAHPDNPALSDAVGNLAVVYRDRGEYARANAIFESDLEAVRRLRGELSVGTALSYDNLSWVRNTLGDHVGARQAAQRSYDIRAALLGESNSLTITSLLRLSDVTRTIGDLEQSRSYAERAFEITRRSPGKDSLDLARAATAMGQVAAEQERHRDARAHFELALGIRERASEPQGNQLSYVRGRVAQTYVGTGEYAVAIPRLEAVARVQEAEPPFFLSQTLELLAEAHHGLGHLDEAHRLRARTYALRDSVLGPDSHRTLEALAALARVELEVGQRPRAFEHALRVEDGARRQLRRMAGALSEREALSYSRIRANGLDLLLDAAAVADATEDMRVAAWDALIRSRSLVYDDLSDRRRSRTAADPEVIRLAAALDSARSDLARRVVSLGPASAPSPALRAGLETSRRRREAAERALNEASAAHRRDRAREAIGLDAVRAGLPRDAALVAFARYRRWSPEAATARDAAMPRDSAPASTRARIDSYMAWVLAGSGPPNPVRLGDARSIDDAVDAWRAQLMSPPRSPREARRAERACTQAGARVRALMWDPLRPHLRGAARVFLVPEAALQLVNVAALPAERGGYLVETSPVIHALTTERDLVPSADEPPPGSGLLAVGDPDFDASPAGIDMPLASREGETPGAPASEPIASAATPSAGAPDLPASSPTALAASRSTPPDTPGRRFPPLRGSGAEATEVVALWRDAFGGNEDGRDVHVLTGAGATESAFKQQAPRRRVLHLATHTFLVGAEGENGSSTRDGGGRDTSALRGVGGLRPAPSSDREGDQGSRSPSSTSPPDSAPAARASDAGAVALARTGLALAGANRLGDTRANGEDGYLTGEEILSLDLRGVQWAVLSACETGVSSGEFAEGVRGLHRAFRTAGVSTVVVSLWPVEDEATRRWMAALYRARLVDGLATGEAIREASRRTLRERRAGGAPTHPFFWASFVGAGDWR